MVKAPDTVGKTDGSEALSWTQSMTDTEELLGLQIDDLLVRMKTSQSGLAFQEAQNRLRIYGYNELAKRKKRTAIVEFLFHVHSPLVIILLIAGLISGFLGEVTDSLSCYYIWWSQRIS